MYHRHYSLLVTILFVSLANGDERQCPSQPSSGTFSTTLRIPEGCKQNECSYFLGITSEESDPNLLHFTLQGKADGWVAIGFSTTPDMSSADVLGCRRTTSGQVEAIDTWNSKNIKVNVLNEPQDDLCYYNSEDINGRLQCTFSRAIRGSSPQYDLDLDNYYYLLYGTGHSSTEGGLSYHKETPLITTDMINPVNGRVKSSLAPVLPVLPTSKRTELKIMNPQTQINYCSTPFLNTTTYRLTQRMPQGCIQSECNYFMGISDNIKNKDMLDFTLQGKAKGWVAVGFSETANMLSADVLGCTVYSDGSLAAIDTWNPSHTKINNLDLSQSDLCQQAVEQKDGMIKCKFSRSITGSTSGQDLILNSYYYLILATGDTPQESLSGGFTFHEQTPTISKILINPVKDNELSVTLTDELAKIQDAPNCPDWFEENTLKYRISLSLPEGCDASKTNCRVFVGINTNSKNNDYLDFTLSGKTNSWVAVGFSNTPNMLSSDVLGCNVYGDGSVQAIDTWNPSTVKLNVVDNTLAGFCQHSARIEDEILTCKFSRKISGTSDGQDLDLNSKYYVMLGTGDTPQDSSTGGFTFHQKTPTIFNKQINPTEDTEPASKLGVGVTSQVKNTRINNLDKSEFSLDMASMQKTETCPSFSSDTSKYRISFGIPKGCEQTKTCNYFLGINQNSKNRTFLDFTLKAKAKGWVAVGFSETRSMPDSDVVGCIRFANGTLRAIDTWNPKTPLVNILDEPQTDICTHGVNYADGKISCKFSRAIKGYTSGRDLDLNKDYYLMFGTGETAQASSGGFTFHQTTPTLTKETINVLESGTVVSLATSSISNSAATALTKTHGIFMIVAWPILAGLAIYFPAYMKPILCKKGEWFQLHRALMLSSMTFGSIAFILIFIANIDSTILPGLAYISDPVVLAHFILGIIVTALPFINALLSLIRCKPTGQYRWIYNLIHGKFIGYFTILLALTNIAVGIHIFFSGTSQAFSIFLIASVIGIMIYLTLHFIYNVLPKLLKDENVGEKAPLASTEESVKVKYQNIKDETYRSNIGILILVELSLVVMNIAVCVCIAAS